MFSLTRMTDYALVAMAVLAKRAPENISVRVIAESVGLPVPAMTKVMRLLLHGGLVESTRGAYGGYGLTKPPEEISLVDLIEAIEGPFRLTVCCGENERVGELDGAIPCEILDGCGIKGAVRRIHGIVRDVFGRVTLANIAFGSAPIGITVAAPTTQAETGADQRAWRAGTKLGLATSDRGERNIADN